LATDRRNTGRIHPRRIANDDRHGLSLEPSASQTRAPSDRQLDAVAVRIEHNALVVPVTRPPRLADNLETGLCDRPRQRVDGRLAAERERDVHEAERLAIPRCPRRDARHPHQLEPWAAVELERVGLEPGGLVAVESGRAAAE